MVGKSHDRFISASPSNDVSAPPWTVPYEHLRIFLSLIDLTRVFFMSRERSRFLDFSGLYDVLFAVHFASDSYFTLFPEDDSLPRWHLNNPTSVVQTSLNSTADPLDISSGSANVAGVGSFPCTQCGRVYRWRTSLVKHLRMECGKEPQFQCPYCPQKLTQKHNLLSHIARKHSNMEAVLPQTKKHRDSHWEGSRDNVGNDSA